MRTIYDYNHYIRNAFTLSNVKTKNLKLHFSNNNAVKSVQNHCMNIGGIQYIQWINARLHCYY